MTATNDNDAKFARDAWIRALQRTAAIDEDPHLTLPVLIAAHNGIVYQLDAGTWTERAPGWSPASRPRQPSRKSPASPFPMS